jgi:inner membrane protein
MGKTTLRESIGTRMFLIGFLIVVLLVPAFMVQFLVEERQGRRNEAITEVTGKWGGEQILTGPVLTVPAEVLRKVQITETNGSKREEVRLETEYLHLLPDFLDIRGRQKPQVLYRGIYEVIVYTSDLTLHATFDIKAIEALAEGHERINWSQAELSLGVRDIKGIRAVRMQWNGVEIDPEPGVSPGTGFAAGISLDVPVVAGERPYTCDVELSLNGSDQIGFVPVGKETRVQLSSSWTNPSFIGNFLPESRSVSAAGFESEWKIRQFNRTFPQWWVDGEVRNIEQHMFGVKLLMAVDEYQKTNRTCKYAILFISLTFLAFFIMELLNSRAIHPIQYLLVGLALLIFYVLLIALTEHILFQNAYMLASVALVLMISTYSRYVLDNFKLAVLTGGVLSTLFGILFVLVQLQDYALLLGSIWLLVIMGLVMYLTKKIDWFTVFKPKLQQ